MLSLLTRTKSFRGWVCCCIELATLCLWRRWPAQLGLERDGFVVLENFLPQPEFEALRDEVEAVVARASRLHPAPDNSRPGFRPKQPFPGGFDRFDGGTLNRFLHIDPEQMPRAAAFSHDQRLSAGSRQVIGLPMNPRKLDIYLTVHGEETRTPDLQKVLHRDTFFRALKFWFFLRPVQPQDGPFEYVPGSHRLDPSRLRWEQATATAAAEQRRQPDVSGSFRIREESLAELGLPKACCPDLPCQHPGAGGCVRLSPAWSRRPGAAAVGALRLEPPLSLPPHQLVIRLRGWAHE